MRIKSFIKIISVSFVFILLFSNLTISYGNSPSISASSAVVMDATTGRVMYAKNSNEKKPMASTTKIMTALLALEKCDLNEIIEVSNEAIGIEGSSIYLGYNEKIAMKDLLYGLMLRSGNDSAVAIAIHIGGSVEGFSKLMNKKAKEIGALNTNFKNPNGLHHNDHYTTAYDLALITREAMKNDVFREIVSTKLHVADREGYKYFYNKNRVLSEYNGGNGVKTGYTIASGRCLVTSATRNNMQLISVVLNAPNWFQDSYKLMDYCFDQFVGVKIIEKNKALKNITVINGKKDKTAVVALKDLVVPLKDDEEMKVEIVFELKDKINAPVIRGTVVGKAKIYLEDTLLYTVGLYSREDIEVKSMKDKIIEYFHN